jgi:hypothetical protein
MIIVRHRINKIKELKEIDQKYGVEVDVRAFGKDIILNHEPFATGDLLEEYLGNYRHSFIIFNIKEAGIEDEVCRLAEKYKIKDYFLLDVEFPYIHKAAQEGKKRIAIRYSEDECIDIAIKYAGKIDWVWIDTISKLPLDEDVVKKLKPFNTALVCPERWGRPDDIENYIKLMKELNFQPDIVMTAEPFVKIYESAFAS